MTHGHDLQELRSVNLNLLMVLDALLHERSATRAAERLGLTQSRISHALGELRQILGDPLFVRRGKGMEPTPRAEALAGPLRRGLRELADVIVGQHLRLLPPPIDIPGFDVMLMWDPPAEAMPAFQWLRATLRRAMLGPSRRASPPRRQDAEQPG